MKKEREEKGEYELLFGNGSRIPLGQITKAEAFKIVLDKIREGSVASLWRATPGTRHMEPITIPSKII